MADTSRFLMVWPLLLATVLPMLYSNFFPLLNQYGGRVALVNPGFVHSTHGPKNNAKCQTFPGLPRTYPPNDQSTETQQKERHVRMCEFTTSLELLS